jgi:molecular chaperone GrpE
MNNEKAKNNKNNLKSAQPEEQKPIEAQNEESCQCKASEPPSQKQDYAALWEKYVRACADFTNARKRWDREKEELIRFSNSSLLRDLLIVLDEAEQALKMAKEHSNVEEIIKGLEMAYGNFVTILKKRGLQAMETKDKVFDPHLHEIVASKEIDEANKPIIIEEVQKGYLLENKVLRPAKVIVGIKKQTTDDRSQKSEEKGQTAEDR